MRLTDEERRIAEGVAAGWVRGGASWDAAWGLAMKYIATRREALGEADTPGTATVAGVAAPRGVVVTEEQREAMETARLIFAQGGEQFDHAADRARAAALDGLLAAIDAAKGGG